MPDFSGIGGALAYLGQNKKPPGNDYVGGGVGLDDYYEEDTRRNYYDF